jgi:hypothetical protein
LSWSLPENLNDAVLQLPFTLGNFEQGATTATALAKPPSRAEAARVTQQRLPSSLV